MLRPDSNPLIVVAEPISDSAMKRLMAIGRVIGPDPEHPDGWLDSLEHADALVVRSSVRLTPETLDRAPSLKVIGRAGTGLDHIDVLAARRRGIEVVYTPAASTNAVAELTVGLIIALQRKVIAGNDDVRSGRLLEARRQPGGSQLSEQTIGIVGMGRIGRAVGRICSKGFDMRVLYNDIVPISGLDFAAESADKPALYAQSDVVSLHVPLSRQTLKMIDRAVLAALKPTACLINTARGRVVDSPALADALEKGRLAGAALDVLDVEPPPADHPLLSAPNCLLSPHVGSRTRASLAAMNDVVDDVIAVLEGRSPTHPAPATLSEPERPKKH